MGPLRVFGGIMVMMCMSWWFSNDSLWGVQSLWFRIMIVILWGFSLASILALCMDYIMLW